MTRRSPVRFTGHSLRAGRRPRWRALVAAAACAAVVASGVSLAGVATAAQAPVGNGFVVTAGDISFILKQIRIAERHAATATASDPCGTLVGPAADQIPDRLSAYGLRTVDGSCNNLFAGREKFAAADVPFPRLVSPSFRPAEGRPTGFFGPGDPGSAGSSYTQKTPGNLVYDSQPRLISNLIVDQTSTNPAAVAAAQFPVRTQGNTGVVPCTVDPTPADPNGTPDNCVPSHKTLFIPNVTTDVGLSPPFNSLFTFFGQFFDHGVDQTVKGSGTVFVPLQDDDPLITLGPDGIPGNGDEVPPGQRFMVLSRGQVQPGPDGVLGTPDDVQDANNTDSPWVDQSQTYTSHASHQVFLREYSMATGRPLSTGKLLGGLPAGQTYVGSPDGTEGISTWAAVKLQARTKLGLLLSDRDVTNIPMLATDPYGNFTPGPNGLPQYVTQTGLVEGDLANPVPVPGNVVHFDTPFLTDIAHNADPSPVDDDNNPATPPVAPAPDADNTPSADFANQPAGTYDDEMLDAHFACGDGRCNENIALSTIHQIFHSEHDRLVDDITATLNKPENLALKNEFLAAHDLNGRDISFGTGGRLFQAARFVTEMEYQHLVFEEFARKVQPAVRPFHVYSPDINPAVDAEFAHAVYRFGHSMLDDDVARLTTVDPATGNQLAAPIDNSLPLLTAFLNPPEYFNDGQGGFYTPQQAAGAIVMGSSDQVGNEIDEFTTEVLRNNLLGLPLDLPTLNMTRARSEGIPPLNEVRRKLFATTGDSQVAPYTDWSDFGNHLKHPESLINFVAAYGKHPTITAATTLAGKRAAARAIVDPAPGDTPPCDAGAFMFAVNGQNEFCPDGTDWSTTATGLDDVDLWVGGLAEVTNLFGGLLGSTFNFVFQGQLEKLQDGDRFYYLNRTPGMNLRTQLEGNSFSEMIQRNTDGTNTLKADAFATADCKFQLANLNGTPAGFAQFGSIVADDVTTPDCDESLLLQRSPNGTIAYKQRNTVDTAGLNSQSVYNGTAGVDRIKGGNDNDTVWGGAGDDVVDGQGGDDVVLGGEGNDIITDLDGADVPKGGPGNDAIDGGPGDDIPMGNEGQDFINGGANDNETFAGEGNDFVIAGQGADAVFGDGGDDWIQGGSGQDLLQGDHGAPFFDDPAETAPGNDIFIGQVGENDYDAEGGDDVMSQNAAVDRNAGAGGFDWAFHQYDTVGADDDMEINNNLVGLPIQVVVNRDRWQETEADSGSDFNDLIKGTSRAPSTVGGAGFTGCNALDQAGVARIKGLDQLVTTFPSDLATVVANSAAGRCPLTAAPAALGGGVWGEGDILIGGKGSDTIEGRGADDIIDGDRYLTVAITVRDANGVEIGRTDLMENKATSGTFGPGTAGMTLQQAVFAGLVDPGRLVAVREIVTPAVPAPDCATTKLNCDTAVFSGPSTNYSVVQGAGFVTVTQTGANVVGQRISDGTDTLRNIEQVRFTDGDFSLVPTARIAPTSLAFGTQRVGTTSATQSVTVTNTGLFPLAVGSVVKAGADAASFTAPTGCAGVTLGRGLSCTVSVAFAPTTVGTKTASLQITTAASTTPVTVTLTGNGVNVPGTPTIGTATFGAGGVTVTWTPPASDGGSPITGYAVRVVNATTNTQVGALQTAPAGATSLTIGGLTGGTQYRFQVQAVNAIGSSPFSTLSNAVTFLTAPAAPPAALAVSGAAGGAVTATVAWTAPANGGSAITGYVVTVINAANTAVFTQTVAPTARTLSPTIPVTAGTLVRFRVQAVNAIGTGAATTSNQVTAR